MAKELPALSDSNLTEMNRSTEPLNKPDEDNAQGCCPCCSACRRRLRRVTDHFFFRIVMLVLIVANIIFEVVSFIVVFIYQDDMNLLRALNITSLVFACMFFTECNLRLIGLGIRTFRQSCLNVLDYCVVLLTLICCLLMIFLVFNKKALVWTRLLLVLRLLRLPLLFLPMRAAWFERHRTQQATRAFVSQNKRRLRYQGYDLDLSYITNNLVAMSFPSQGWMAIYRNHIAEVVSFLNHTHKRHYKVYNLCAEMGYEASWFGGRCGRLMVMDHNVPTFPELVRFANEAKYWLEKDPAGSNVLVVHCKGGKGRTGTCLCVTMLIMGYVKTAREALDLFGQRRTDRSISDKFQGVETPSQSRYVGYYEEYLNSGLTVIPERSVYLKSIRINGAQNFGKHGLRVFDMTIEVVKDRNAISSPTGKLHVPKVVYHVDFGDENMYQQVDKISQSGQIDYVIYLQRFPDAMVNASSDRLKLDGDVRVKFTPIHTTCCTKSVPVAYEKCAFYFWFNTAYLKENKLSLSREELDNPHKESTWHIYGQEFQVVLLFD